MSEKSSEKSQNKSQETKNDKAWEQLFKKYSILQRVDMDGFCPISAEQIREYREPRLMTKFDHKINLPSLFAKNRLMILPVTRGDYVISHFDAYHSFEEDIKAPVTRLSLPAYLQSIDSNHITSEAIALNCAVASGIIADFLEDFELVPTVSGRMSSGSFSFNINDTKKNSFLWLSVQNSQIEIDAAYEGIHSLALFEAKCDVSSDFLIRQLYYPFRVWNNRVAKPVRPVFFVYSNGIYRLYEYTFEDIEVYNSLRLVKQRNYSIEDTTISMSDLQMILQRVALVKEPSLPFPQADKFERVVNLCELLAMQNLTTDDITQNYAFDVRQTDYYTNAARYLGLVEKQQEDGIIYYVISEMGRRILNLPFKQKQLEFCKLILSHKAFNLALQRWLQSGVMPEKSEIVEIMKQCNLYHIDSDETYRRRSSSIRGWLNWMIDLINEP